MFSTLHLSLGLYFIVMLGIGAYSYLTTEKNVSGFMLGGRKMGPAITALSAGASDMSGWILLGLPGLVFVTGLSGSWMAMGLVIGAYANYRLVAPRLRIYTEQLNDAVTIPEYLERRFSDHSHTIRIISSAVIIVFFTLYMTSGLVAGGKLFESSFGVDYTLGLYITASVVVLYSAFGGFAAVSMTDFIQGCLMLVALLLVPVVTVFEMGGVQQTTQQLNELNPLLLSFGGVSTLAIISAASWGLGYFGQPHIIVRFMAISHIKELPTARRIGMSWMILSILGTISVGLAGAAYASSHNLKLDDPETIFIVLSNTLFHPVIAGFLLAAILAAIMSTISSQLLVSSSSITEDVYHTFLRKNASEKERLFVAKASLVAVALLSLYLATDENNSILSLVGNAWAGFGASFGPVVLISLFWGRMTKMGALTGMIAGASVVLLWLYAPITIGDKTLSENLYEIVPGFITACIVSVGVSMFTTPNQRDIDNFCEMEKELKLD